MADIKKISTDINNLIKNYNVLEMTHCLTRLRIKFASDVPNKNDILAIPGVMGCISSGDEFQIILGPNTVDQVYDELKKMKDVSSIASTANTNKTNFDDIKQKYRKNPVSQTLTKFAKIFSPLIPAFVGAGIIAGAANLISAFTNVTDNVTNWPAYQWYKFFQIALSAWSSAFLIIVGWRFCEIFNGKQWAGGVIAAMFTPLAGAAFVALYRANPDGTGMFLGVPVHNIHLNWFTSGLANVDTSNPDKVTYVIGPPIGSMFGIILSCSASIWIERGFNKIIKGSVNFAFVPILTILCILFLNIILIIPISGYIIVGLSYVIQHISQGPGAPFGDMLLTFIFLFCLTLGIHTAFIPIYVMLLTPAYGGLNTIFPLLGMGSGGQIGTAIALFLIAKKGSNYRKQIKPWIVSAVLGIDEPLLYGNNIPRIVPLFTSCLGCAVGGFFIGMMNAWAHIPMGVDQPFGVNGVWGLITVYGGTDGNMWLAKMVYGLGFIISISCGFGFGLLGYRIYRNNPKINWSLN